MPLKRYYREDDFVVFEQAAWLVEYPVWIRRKSAKTMAVRCSGPLDLIAKADLFFDENPRATIEVLRSKKLCQT